MRALVAAALKGLGEALAVTAETATPRMLLMHMVRTGWVPKQYSPDRTFQEWALLRAGVPVALVGLPIDGSCDEAEFNRRLAVAWAKVAEAERWPFDVSVSLAVPADLMTEAKA